MAEVAEMGEVDEMHSKEEGDLVLNGDANEDVDMESQDSQDSIKKPSITVPEAMEVTENGEDKGEDNDSDNSSTSSSSSSSSSDSSSDVENENTAEGSSVATEKNSVENDDGNSQGSQGTLRSESQEGQSNNEDGNEKSEISKENGEEEKESKDDEDKDSSKDLSKGDEEELVVNAKDNDSSNKDKEDSEDNIKNENKSSKSIEIHEINDDDDHSKDETIELNDSGGEDGDVIVVGDGPKQNGTAGPTEIIDLDATPEKKQKIKSKPSNVTPRRSSRNLNKTKSYAESDKEDTPPPPQEDEDEDDSEESDIEEVLPDDPLAVSSSVTVERVPAEKVKQPKSSSTIVVKDTKRLVEIASKSNSTSTPGKKEPTLVIIDTNSILSGRGPVPITKPSLPTATFPTVLPMAVPAQGMYPANMRATITPIPINSSSLSSSATLRTVPAPATITPSAPLLPTLTDDMFVVEAPSFIVPYVYEKPPVKEFKEFVKEVKNDILERKKKEKEEKKKLKKQKSKKSKESKESDEDTEGKSSKKNKKAKTEEEDDEDEDEDEAMDVDEEDSDESYEPDEPTKDDKKPYSYFQSPLGKFFIDIGFNMVQEYVQSDLLKQQKRKRDREGGNNPETEKNIHSLIKNLEYSKENNEAFKMTLKKCEFCSFRTESQLAMAYHLETPHMKNFVYRCNFCSYEVRSPHDILFHMEAEHAIRGHLERAPAFHQCPNCPFEDNQKGKLSRHLVTCMRKFKPERNLEPPIDWEPPAKIPRMPKLRQQGLNATAAAYQAMTKNSQYQLLSKMQLQSNAMQRGRGRPSLPSITTQKLLRPPGMVFKQQTMSGSQVLVPTNYQVSGNQIFQVVGGQELGGRLGALGPTAFVPNVPSASSTVTIQNSQGKKSTSQPSISITPLPRGTAAVPAAGAVAAKPGDTTSKNSFVICEICDGYIKDLEQLRNHMQWIHKIKIHPKMIYNRPPLNCQKCQFRFFTDQGLERHLLGSHGLVTSSMQDAANKSKDSGRCPVCGRVYQWKLLNHVARDHNMTLKPAHLSYKCTVCTATFGMYKQFENHVYSAHSVVAKRVMDKKAAAPSPAAPSASGKPLKINDEITIIPQPAKAANGKEGAPGTSKSR